MDLIDRYLAAIAVLLPVRGRADILAELKDVLLSRREEKEAELGRPLTRAEDEALIEGFGHPVLVAGRYGGQQHLIGPEFYPLYTFVLKIVLACVVAGALITGVVNAAVRPGDPGAIVGAVIGVLGSGGWVAFGAVTVTIAALERFGVKLGFLERWSVRELPQLGRRRRRRRVAWLDHVAAIVVQAIFLLWWMGAITLWPSHVPLEAGRSLDLGFGPMWQGLYWPVIVLSFAVIAVHAVRLAEVTAQLGHLLDFLLQAATLAIAVYLLRFGGGWVEVVGHGVAPEVLAKIRHGIDIGLQVGLIVVLASAIAKALYDLWRIVRPQPLGAPAP
jgi:hypothetical protein